MTSKKQVFLQLLNIGQIFQLGPANSIISLLIRFFWV